MTTNTPNTPNDTTFSMDGLKKYLDARRANGTYKESTYKKTYMPVYNKLKDWDFTLFSNPERAIEFIDEHYKDSESKRFRAYCLLSTYTELQPYKDIVKVKKDATHSIPKEPIQKSDYPEDTIERVRQMPDSDGVYKCVAVLRYDHEFSLRNADYLSLKVKDYDEGTDNYITADLTVHFNTFCKSTTASPFSFQIKEHYHDLFKSFIRFLKTDKLIELSPEVFNRNFNDLIKKMGLQTAKNARNFHYSEIFATQDDLNHFVAMYDKLNGSLLDVLTNINDYSSNQLHTFRETLAKITDISIKSNHTVDVAVQHYLKKIA